MSAEWAAQFNTSQYPWPEPPLPSYFHQLTPWNQELIRRARAGNTNRILSVYDRKTNTWISGAEQERKAAALKFNSLNVSEPTEKPRNDEDADSPKSGDDSGAEDSSNEYSKSADEDDFEGDETTPFKTTSAKRRKVSSRHDGPDESRTIEVTKWVPLAPSQADKAHDRNFLAPRRPGMPALYNPEYAQSIFGRYHSSNSFTGTSSYDLGEGGGLNNASGVLGAGPANDNGSATPRKNVPPRRKKKKIGGPGRKKATTGSTLTGDTMDTPVSGYASMGDQGAGADAMQGVEGGHGQNASGNATRNPDDNDMAQDDGDNDSGSEAEGSEEGEIDESGGAGSSSRENQITSMSTAARVDSSSSKVVSLEPMPVNSSNETATQGFTSHPADTTTNLTAQPHQSPPSSTAMLQPTITVTTTDNNTDTPMTDLTSEPAQPPQPEAQAPSATPTIPAPQTEEQQIVLETADALSSTHPAPATDTEPFAASHPAAATLPEEPSDKNASPTTGAANDAVQGATTEEVKPVADADADAEVDLLGGLDAAIDREVSEGA